MEAKININTIAKMAGVSTTTVSNFINWTETIPLSPAKRERIMDAMREANYRPSSASSQLRRNSVLPGRSIFIYGSNPEGSPFDTARTPMLSELVSQLDRVLRKRLRLALEVRAVEDEDSTEAWNEAIADAGSVICYGRLDAALHELSLRRNIPMIVVSDTQRVVMRGHSAPDAELDCVYWDSPSHLEKALERLEALGAKRLAFVSSWNIERNHKAGFAAEAEAKMRMFESFIAARPGLSGEIFCPPMPENVSPYYEARNAYAFALREPRLFESFDAIAGHNDFVARGIVDAMGALGIAPERRPPVWGEGDYPECRFCVPPVPSVSYDRAALAEAVAGLLAKRLETNRPLGARIAIPSVLMERNA